MDFTWRYFSWRSTELPDLQKRLDNSFQDAYACFREELARVDSYDPDDRIYARNWAATLRSMLSRVSSHLGVSAGSIPVYRITEPQRRFYHGWSSDLDPKGSASELIAFVQARSPGDVVFRPICLETANREIMQWLSKHPEDVDRLHHRTFEAILAEVVRSHGWEVELTKRTRDGGYDLICLRSDELGFPVPMIVEAKLFGEGRPVGLPMVDRLMGAASRAGAHRAVLVTNSRFTSPAWAAWESRVGRDLDLIDREELLSWLRQYSALVEQRSEISSDTDDGLVAHDHGPAEQIRRRTD